MMRANSAFFPRNNPSECPDNVRVPASSAWACHNPEVTADWNSDPRSSGECRLKRYRSLFSRSNMHTVPYWLGATSHFLSDILEAEPICHFSAMAKEA